MSFMSYNGPTENRAHWNKNGYWKKNYLQQDK